LIKISSVAGKNKTEDRSFDKRGFNDCIGSYCIGISLPGYCAAKFLVEEDKMEVQLGASLTDIRVRKMINVVK
jgi:hypothetical protein